MVDSSNLKLVAEPWSLRPNYNLTAKLFNSSAPIARVAKYTGVTLAVLAVAETIKAIVAIPFKVLGNLFGLYKYATFKAPRMEKIIDETSSDNAQKNLSWKKALYIAGTVLGLGILVWGGIKLYPSMPSVFTKPDAQTGSAEGVSGQPQNSANQPDISQTKQPVQSASSSSPKEPPSDNSGASKTAPQSNLSPEESFIRSYEKKEQCPSFDTCEKHQQKHKYFGLSIDSLRRLFGAESDLTVVEARLGFYHGITDRLPEFAKTHHLNNGAKSLEELPKEVAKEIAKDMSTLRNTARAYARERSYKEVQDYLDKHEPRDKEFDYFWEHYDQNSTRVIQAATRSNSFYDNPYLLKAVDIIIPIKRTWEKRLAKLQAKILPSS